MATTTIRHHITGLSNILDQLDTIDPETKAALEGFERKLSDALDNARYETSVSDTVAPQSARLPSSENASSADVLGALYRISELANLLRQDGTNRRESAITIAQGIISEAERLIAAIDKPADANGKDRHVLHSIRPLAQSIYDDSDGSEQAHGNAYAIIQLTERRSA